MTTQQHQIGQLNQAIGWAMTAGQDLSYVIGVLEQHKAELEGLPDDGTEYQQPDSLWVFEGDEPIIIEQL